MINGNPKSKTATKYRCTRHPRYAGAAAPRIKCAMCEHVFKLEDAKRRLKKAFTDFMVEAMLWPILFGEPSAKAPRGLLRGRSVVQTAKDWQNP